MDTSASSHISSSLEDLVNERRLRLGEVTLKLRNGASITAKAIVSTSIDLHDHVLLLYDVLNVPYAYKIIISIPSFTRKNYEFHFKNDVCNIYYGNEMVSMGYLIQGLYYGNNI